MAEGQVNLVGEQALPARSFWHTPADFVLHTIVGTCIFATVAIPAILLDLLVQTLGRHVSSFVIYGVQTAEYALFCTDLVLMLIFLIKTAWRTAKKI
jgi:hypothetical protein